MASGKQHGGCRCLPGQSQGTCTAAGGAVKKAGGGRRPFHAPHSRKFGCRKGREGKRQAVAREDPRSGRNSVWVCLWTEASEHG